MPEVTQKVSLLRHTLSPEEVVALGARLCYSRATLTDLEQRIAAKDQRAFVEKLLDMGHESVLEHASFTFGVEGVSRVLLAQLAAGIGGVADTAAAQLEIAGLQLRVPGGGQLQQVQTGRAVG